MPAYVYSESVIKFNNNNVEFQLLRRTSVDSSIRSEYDGSCVTRHFADTERSIPSESVRTSANDNWRSVDDSTCR